MPQRRCSNQEEEVKSENKAAVRSVIESFGDNEEEDYKLEKSQNSYGVSAWFNLSEQMKFISNSSKRKSNDSNQMLPLEQNIRSAIKNITDSENNSVRKSSNLNSEFL